MTGTINEQLIKKEIVRESIKKKVWKIPHKGLPPPSTSTDKSVGNFRSFLVTDQACCLFYSYLFSCGKYVVSRHYYQNYGMGGVPRWPLLLIPVLSSSHLLQRRERGDKINFFQLSHLSSPCHNKTRDWCSSFTQL